MAEAYDYHRPVLLQETVDGLTVKPGGVYVDATMGGGGHTRELLARSAEIKVYGFDKDPDAIEKAKEWADERVTIVQADFRYLKKYLRLYGVRSVDGIMADLGVSSHQIDQAERGFSTRADGPLDMRMDQAGERSAADILNSYEEADLVHILSAYGEVRNAKTLAKAILAARINRALERTTDLLELAKPLAPRGKEFRYFAQVFQALRIEVNQEMQGLREFLEGTAEVLKPRGRLSVITYHSLEDRPVKRFLQHGNFKGKPVTDVYGNPLGPFDAVKRKPVLAEESELEANPRARSAKLRIAERNENIYPMPEAVLQGLG